MNSRRILHVNRICYLDDSNGAAVSSRALLEVLQWQGFTVEALTGSIIEVGEELNPASWLESRGFAPSKRDFGYSATVDARGVVEDNNVDHRVVNGVSATILLGHPGRPGDPSDDECRDFLAWLDRTLDLFRPDVVVNFGGDRLSNAIRATVRRAGIAVVFPLHNLSYDVRWPFDDVAAALVPSRFAADHYRRTIGLECAVIPNPVEFGRARATDHHPRYLTFVNPSPEKGVFVFARIADELARTRPDIPFLVVEARGSERTLAECGLNLARNGNISLMTHTSDPRQFWGVTKLCLMPSLCMESQGLVAVEAMINGIPVIGSDRGALPETLGNGGIALPLPDRLTPLTRELPTASQVTPWIKAIIDLWEDPSWLAERSHRAKREADRWAPEVLGPQYAQLFANVRPLA